MKNDDIKKLIETNQRLVFIIGYSVAMICSTAEQGYLTKDDKYKWLMEAISNVIYLDKPLPPMPK